MMTHQATGSPLLLRQFCALDSTIIAKIAMTRSILIDMIIKAHIVVG